MSDLAHYRPLHIEAQQTLEQLLTLLPVASLPVTLACHNKQLHVVENSNNATSLVDSDTELVMFADAKVEQLCAVINLLNLDVVSLTATNYRAGRTSVRFQVSKRALEHKAPLNEFAMHQHIELALLANAPSLAVPGLLLMDMDSTAIDIECIDQIAALAGVGEQVSEVTEKAMLGELDFAQSLRERVSKLNGASADILAQVADNLPLMPGLETLVSTLQQHQWKVAVASGGFTYFTDILKQRLNLDATQANVLEINENILTGKVLGEITDAQTKADTLTRLATEFAIDQQQTVAMGDGANDLIMMSAAHLGIAYKAKPIVLQQASAAINAAGLDTLLHYLR